MTAIKERKNINPLQNRKKKVSRPASKEFTHPERFGYGQNYYSSMYLKQHSLLFKFK